MQRALPARDKVVRFLSATVGPGLSRILAPQNSNRQRSEQDRMKFLTRMLDAFINVAACGGILYVGIHIGYLLHAILY